MKDGIYQIKISGPQPGGRGLAIVKSESFMAMTLNCVYVGKFREGAQTTFLDLGQKGNEDPGKGRSIELSGNLADSSFTFKGEEGYTNTGATLTGERIPDLTYFA